MFTSIALLNIVKILFHVVTLYSISLNSEWIRDNIFYPWQMTNLTIVSVFLKDTQSELVIFGVGIPPKLSEEPLNMNRLVK